MGAMLKIQLFIVAILALNALIRLVQAVVAVIRHLNSSPQHKAGA